MIYPYTYIQRYHMYGIYPYGSKYLLRKCLEYNLLWFGGLSTFSDSVWIHIYIYIIYIYMHINININIYIYIWQSSPRGITPTKLYMLFSVRFPRALAKSAHIDSEAVETACAALAVNVLKGQLPEKWGDGKVKWWFNAGKKLWFHGVYPLVN